MPVGDWQFWVVTLAALIAAAAVARMVWPAGVWPRGKVRGKRAKLTIGKSGD